MKRGSKVQYSCNDCGRGFFSQLKYDTHLKDGVHTAPRPRGGKREKNGGKREGAGRPNKYYTEEVIANEV